MTTEGEGRDITGGRWWEGVALTGDQWVGARADRRKARLGWERQFFFFMHAVLPAPADLCVQYIYMNECISHFAMACWRLGVPLMVCAAKRPLA